MGYVLLSRFLAVARDTKNLDVLQADPAAAAVNRYDVIDLPEVTSVVAGDVVGQALSKLPLVRLRVVGFPALHVLEPHPGPAGDELLERVREVESAAPAGAVLQVNQYPELRCRRLRVAVLESGVAACLRAVLALAGSDRSDIAPGAAPTLGREHREVRRAIARMWLEELESQRAGPADLQRLQKLEDLCLHWEVPFRASAQILLHSSGVQH
jgi:hypothetical protein